MAEKLDGMRRGYSSADTSGKRRVASGIRTMEKQLEQLRTNIRQTEKEIRNAENMAGE